MEKEVKSGDSVRIHYTGKFEDGSVFDSSREGEPLQFEVGSGQIIEGLDKAVIGMHSGEKKTVTVDPEQGFGVYNDSLLLEMPKDKIPEHISPEIGMKLQLVDEKGNALPVVVREILDESIKLDANHPLAGKVLVFDI
ncbi:MAG: peptidylprolyl isomerase, partial [Candidatus Aminicenantales bacterium]